MWDTKIRELIDRLFIEANGNKSAFEEALREADIEFVSSESDIVAVPSKYEEENTVYNYFEDGGGVWCYLAYPVCCQYDKSVIICRSRTPRLSNNASRFSAGFSR